MEVSEELEDLGRPSYDLHCYLQHTAVRGFCGSTFQLLVILLASRIIFFKSARLLFKMKWWKGELFKWKNCMGKNPAELEKGESSTETQKANNYKMCERILISKYKLPNTRTNLES